MGIKDRLARLEARSPDPTKEERREGVRRAIDALECMRRRQIETGSDEMVAENEFEQWVLDGPVAKMREIRRLAEEGVPDAQIAERFDIDVRKAHILTRKIRKAWTQEGSW